MTISLTKRLRTLRPAVALAATAFYCASPDAAPQSCGQSGIIDTLFEFSQRAERPQDQENESLNCPPGDEPILTVPNLSAVPFPPSTDDDVTQELRVREIPGNPFAESSRDNSRMYVVCPREFRISTLTKSLDIAVEMMVLRANSGTDTVRLDVVAREPAEPSSERPAGEWTPVIGPQGPITFPGTKRSDSRQILANLFHNPCLFPAAHLAFHALCTVPNTPAPTDSPGTARVPTSEEPASGWLRTDESGRPNVVGHSLGGAVTQYIAIKGPPVPRSTDGDSQNACPGVNAYSFGSTGLTTSTVNDDPSIHGNLMSYASDCDFLVHCVPTFPQRVQPGHVFTLRSNAHWIDDIQEDLCSCRQSAGTQKLYDHGTAAQPPNNDSLFQLANRSTHNCSFQPADCRSLLGISDESDASGGPSP